MRRITLLALLLLIVSPAGGSPTLRTAADYFAGGKVESFRARRIRIVYDVSAPGMLADFEEVDPFLAEPRGGFEVRDDALRAEGVRALRHKGIFEADVAVHLTLISDRPQDLGVVLLEPGLTDQYLLFSLADSFFSLRDKMKPGQHMVTVVGAEDEGARGETLFRYLSRTREPQLVPGEPIPIEVRKKGKRNRFLFAGRSMDAEDRYGEFPTVQPALFVLEAGMTVTKLVIEGKLTEEFLGEAGIEWDPSEKDEEAVTEIAPPPGGMVPVEPEPERGGRRWPRRPGGGERESGTAGLVRRIADSGRSEEERKEAAAGLSRENVKLDELRSLIQHLSSGDVLTRTLAITVLKKVTGKTLGYKPGASENARSRAVRNWFRFMMENRERFR